MSLRPSSAKTFWVTMAVSLQSSFPTTELVFKTSGGYDKIVRLRSISSQAAIAMKTIKTIPNKTDCNLHARRSDVSLLLHA